MEIEVSESVVEQGRAGRLHLDTTDTRHVIRSLSLDTTQTRHHVTDTRNNTDIRYVIMSLTLELLQAVVCIHSVLDELSGWLGSGCICISNSTVCMQMSNSYSYNHLYTK